MQYMNAIWISSNPSELNKPLNSNSKPHHHPLNFLPRTQILCNSNPYYTAKTDENENGQSSIKTLPLPYHVKTITSTSNPFVRHCLKLRQSSSYRHTHGSVLLVGSTPIRSIGGLSLYYKIPLFLNRVGDDICHLWIEMYILKWVPAIFVSSGRCFLFSYVLWVFVIMPVLVCDCLWLYWNGLQKDVKCKWF